MFYLNIKKTLLAGFITAFTMTSIAGPSFSPVQTSSDVNKLINFLTASVDSGVGISYVASAGELKGLTLPLSYYNTPEYWGEYVCQLPGHNCVVTDLYYGDRYPEWQQIPDNNTPGAELQTERVNVNNGTDVYDGAAWQIALALAANNGIQGNNGQSLFDMARNETTLLTLGYNGDASEPVNGANRATTRDDTFVYNGSQITNPEAAYFYRMVSRNWVSQDPFKDTDYAKQYLSIKNISTDSDKHQSYELGDVTWMDWKPITGENAWAFFEGPLQTDYLDYVKTRGLQYIPFKSDSVQNALNIVPTISRMTSSLGGIYYGTKGALGNTGEQAINHYDVSVENIASALGGLMMFHQVLSDQLAYQPDLNKKQTAQIETAISQIEAIVYGGRLVDGRYTDGVMCFLKNYAWDNSAGYLLQGGLIDEPGSARWQPTTDPKAVDVTTWGITVIGQPLIDEWHGFGSAYNAWKNIKPWGGYCGGESPCPADQPIMGVAYSNQDANAIMSVEWTAGAVNLLRALITQYDAIANGQVEGYTDAQVALAQSYVADMVKDERIMLENLQRLRIDNYAKDPQFASVRPDGYSELLDLDSQDWANKSAYIYASKRYMIPFGWYANPLPSSTSAAWMVMLYYNFNPFKLGGDYQAIQFDKNKLAAMECNNVNNTGPLKEDTTIEVANKVKDAKLVAINYHNQEGEQFGPQLEDNDFFVVPQGTTKLTAAYTIDGENWYGACVIDNPSVLREGDIVEVIWTNTHGTGLCTIK